MGDPDKATTLVNGSASRFPNNRAAKFNAGGNACDCCENTLCACLDVVAPQTKPYPSSFTAADFDLVPSGYYVLDGDKIKSTVNQAINSEPEPYPLEKNVSFDFRRDNEVVIKATLQCGRCPNGSGFLDTGSSATFSVDSEPNTESSYSGSEISALARLAFLNTTGVPGEYGPRFGFLVTSGMGAPSILETHHFQGTPPDPYVNHWFLFPLTDTHSIVWHYVYGPIAYGHDPFSGLPILERSCTQTVSVDGQVVHTTTADRSVLCSQSGLTDLTVKCGVFVFGDSSLSPSVPLDPDLMFVSCSVDVVAGSEPPGPEESPRDCSTVVARYPTYSTFTVDEVYRLNFSGEDWTLAPGRVVSIPLAIYGATSTVTVTAIGGSLPTGLSLNATSGEITGTPSTESTGTFRVNVSDLDGHSVDTRVYAWRVQVPVEELEAVYPDLYDNNLDPATHTAPPNWLLKFGFAPNDSYTITPVVAGGSGTFTATLAAGSLPPGGSLNPSTGVISGTISNDESNEGTGNCVIRFVDAVYPDLQVETLTYDWEAVYFDDTILTLLYPLPYSNTATAPSSGKNVRDAPQGETAGAGSHPFYMEATVLGGTPPYTFSQTGGVGGSFGGGIGMWLDVSLQPNGNIQSQITPPIRVTSIGGEPSTRSIEVKVTDSLGAEATAQLEVEIYFP